MTLVLHYAPDNASLIVRIVLEELGLAYSTRLVDRSQRAQDSAAYRSINPAGLIPALETPQGVIFETGAIVLWLADRHGRMAPAPDAPERGDFLKWLFFVSNTVHAGLRMTFYPEKYAGAEPSAQSALRATLRARLRGDFHLLDTALVQSGDDYFGGDAPNVLDIYLAALMRWSALYPQGQTGWFDIQSHPALWEMAQALEQRPATRAAQRAEGLGPTPFTAPSLANPPEGSAT
ncbi:glutathione S-transferase family protein [Tropicibacter oceani]|uniref:Glutathione S-transferase family protein n=1 Tax=Tropicibacter oceani TaxID=3058420 RepID=A0ABY8QCC2_9RHOB|nr:glutathione S-transferase family protein [Tropicibacter oceani]WGW02272.1 glutathione S-transferase family protein [Tropicibacter oceani]